LLDQALEGLIAHYRLDRAPAGICVFNPTSWRRTDLVEFDCADAENVTALKSADGTMAAVQPVRDETGKLRLLGEAADVGPFAWRYYEPLTAANRQATENLISVSPQRIENPLLRIDLTDTGLIRQITCKATGQTFVPEGQTANVLQLIRETPGPEEAWNIDPAAEEHIEELTALDQVQVVESGPLRGKLRLKRSFGNSEIVQDITVYRSKPVIDFRTRVKWQERRRMLKVSMPTNIRSQYATYEVAYGAYQRPTYRNTSWEQQRFEVAMHRFVDLSEGGRGVSLLNDCKYGGDVLGGRIRLTLLRAPTLPDPDADRGEHEFTYSLYVHQGDWRSAGVVQRAAELNAPLLVRHVGQKGGKVDVSVMPTQSPLSVDAENVIIEVLKKAEDGEALVLRAYEACGNATTAAFRFAFKVGRVTECDLLERPEQDLALRDNGFEAAFRPFEIKTFLIDLVQK